MREAVILVFKSLLTDQTDDFRGGFLCLSGKSAIKSLAISSFWQISHYFQAWLYRPTPRSHRTNPRRRPCLWSSHQNDSVVINDTT